MMNLNDEKVVLGKGLKALNARDHEIQAMKLSLEVCLEQDDMLRAEEVAFELNNAYEKQIQVSRNLPVYIRRPAETKAPDRLVPENEQARVGFTKEGWFCAVIPALLPKKEKGSPDFVRETLYSAMIRFFKDKEPVCYADCTLVFRHIYGKTRPKRRYRDHDNIEANAVVDILALYLLVDDSPMLCEHLNQSGVLAPKAYKKVYGDGRSCNSVDGNAFWTRCSDMVQ